MLVTHILGDCPECGGKRRYGNVSVRADHVLRGCMNCGYSDMVWLPEIRKTILYLDQCFLSSAFREQDDRFVEAAKEIRHVSELQLLVAPFSSVHEDETHQWRGYDGKHKEDLLEFIKATCRGHEFQTAYYVERRQIVKAFCRFVSGEPAAFELEDCDAVDKDIHRWEDYFRIDVGRYVGNIESVRDSKRQSVQELVDLFPGWRQSTASFGEDVALELRWAAKGYLDSYVTNVARVASGDYTALIDSPVMAMVVEELLHCLPDEVPPEARLKRIGEFLESLHFEEIPYQQLSATIFAALKDMVRRGAYTNRDRAIQRLSGFFEDVKHVATYAPYCDAFVMDQAMASLVADPRIGLEKKYRVKVFSLNNWDRFHAWLRSLEAGMSQEHREALAAAYP
jgi:hypothetical protein